MTSETLVKAPRALHLAAPEGVDVVDLASRCVCRAQTTANCTIGFMGSERAIAQADPVALSRAFGCVLDNAVRAAGPGGHVTVEVHGTAHETTVRVIDDGPGLGHVPIHNSLSLTVARALVRACGGGFDLRSGPAGGLVARIVLLAADPGGWPPETVGV